MEELQARTKLWVELGLQTADETTARFIRRGYENQVFTDAVTALSRRNISVVAHTILGLPAAVCNRLDRNTSGIVVAGKTLRAVQAVNAAIRARHVEKYYITLVNGVVDQAGEIDWYLAKEASQNQVRVSQIQRTGYQQALTTYRPLAHTAAYTLLELQLITGKTHQIRAHMQAIGHPVLGDRKYGDPRIISSAEKFCTDYLSQRRRMRIRSGLRIKQSNDDFFVSVHIS